MLELKHARDAAVNKPVLTIFIVEKPFDWANDEIKDLCQITSKKFVDIGAFAKDPCSGTRGALSTLFSSSVDPWEAKDGPTVEMINQLGKELEPVLTLLGELHCRPSHASMSAGAASLPPTPPVFGASLYKVQVKSKTLAHRL